MQMMNQTTIRDLDLNEIQEVSGGASFNYECAYGVEMLDVEAFGYSFSYTNFAGGGGGWGLARGNEWIVMNVF